MTVLSVSFHIEAVDKLIMLISFIESFMASKNVTPCLLYPLIALTLAMQLH